MFIKINRCAYRMNHEKGAALLTALVFTSIVFGISMFIITGQLSNTKQLDNRYAANTGYWYIRSFTSTLESGVRTYLVKAYYEEVRKARSLETLKEEEFKTALEQEEEKRAKQEEEGLGNIKLNKLPIFDNPEVTASVPLLSFKPDHTWFTDRGDGDYDVVVPDGTLTEKSLDKCTSLLGNLNNWLDIHAKNLVHKYAELKGYKVPEMGRVEFIREAHREKLEDLYGIYPNTNLILEFVVDATSDVTNQYARLRQNGRIVLGSFGTIDLPCLKPEINIAVPKEVDAGEEISFTWESRYAQGVKMRVQGEEFTTIVGGIDEEADLDDKDKGEYKIRAIPGQQVFQFQAFSSCGESRIRTVNVRVKTPFVNYENVAGNPYSVAIIQNPNNGDWDGYFYSRGGAKYNKAKGEIDFTLEFAHTLETKQGKQTYRNGAYPRGTVEVFDDSGSFRRVFTFQDLNRHPLSECNQLASISHCYYSKVTWSMKAPGVPRLSMRFNLESLSVQDGVYVKTGKSVTKTITQTILSP
jgi:hypothetical protein